MRHCIITVWTPCRAFYNRHTMEELDEILKKLDAINESALKKLFVIRGLVRELDRIEQEILNEIERVQ